MGYRARLLDRKLEVLLRSSKVVSILGAKGVGKGESGKRVCASSIDFLNPDERRAAFAFPETALKGDSPRLIHEYRLVPSLTQEVEKASRQEIESGSFVLTSSMEETSGTESPAVCELLMYPMSTFEMGRSLNVVSLLELKRGNVKPTKLPPLSFHDIVDLIFRGGWPGNVDLSLEEAVSNNRRYLSSILNGRDRSPSIPGVDQAKLGKLLRALARNESKVVSKADLYRDRGRKPIASRPTMDGYYDLLKSMFLIDEQEAFRGGDNRSIRRSLTPKRYLVDPSLSALLLRISPETVKEDFLRFASLFESLVERDLRVYADYYGASLYHFRDSSGKTEVDAILEFSDGEYGAIEIKLSDSYVPEARRKLADFASKMEKAPCFSAVIVGSGSYLAQDVETGVWTIPLNALGVKEDWELDMY